MPERGRPMLRGHAGRSFLDAGMWILDEDGGDPVYFPPTIRSAVDQLADLAQDQCGQARDRIVVEPGLRGPAQREDVGALE